MACASAVSQWLKSRGVEVKDIRQKGGVSIRILARDPNAAIESMRERLESMAARVRVGSNRQFTLLPVAWIDGVAKEFRLAHEGREVDVHSLGERISFTHSQGIAGLTRESSYWNHWLRAPPPRLSHRGGLPLKPY